MRYRRLGKTNLKISEIGYGTWQLANDPGIWVGADLNESLKCLHRYVELGGNFIDTAWAYGYSADRPDRHPSEELIGRFLKQSGNKGKVIVATKIAPKNWKWPAWRGTPIEEVFPDDHIEKCVDDSLRSLGVDAIDLMQFHVWQDYFVDSDGWKKTIEKLIKAGKVKFWGISVNDYQPSNCLRAIDTGLISTIQSIFNIFHQKPIEKLFPAIAKNDLGLIIRVPLDEGGLSGKFDEKTTFSEGDFRSTYFTEERLKELGKRTNRVKALAPEMSLAELGLRFILSFPEVSVAIPVVDDRLEVLSHLVGVVSNLYLFQPDSAEVEAFRQFLPEVTRVEGWQEMLEEAKL